MVSDNNRVNINSLGADKKAKRQIGRKIVPI
jgi:hypothetical protein